MNVKKKTGFYFNENTYMLYFQKIKLFKKEINQIDLQSFDSIKLLNKI